jgi:hypothetical protein
MAWYLCHVAGSPCRITTSRSSLASFEAHLDEACLSTLMTRRVSA